MRVLGCIARVNIIGHFLSIMLQLREELVEKFRLKLESNVNILTYKNITS